MGGNSKDAARIPSLFLAAALGLGVSYLDLPKRLMAHMEPVRTPPAPPIPALVTRSCRSVDLGGMAGAPWGVMMRWEGLLKLAARSYRDMREELMGYQNAQRDFCKTNWTAGSGMVKRTLRVRSGPDIPIFV
jgi:hypothetical protein